MTDPKERAAFSEFRAALDTARSEYMDALKEADEEWTHAVRKRGIPEPSTQRLADSMGRAQGRYFTARLAALHRYGKVVVDE